MTGERPRHDPPYSGRSSVPCDLTVSLRDYVDLRMVEKEKAIERLERNLDERFAGISDARDALERASSTHATRDWVEAKIDAEVRGLSERIDGLGRVAGDYAEFRAATLAQTRTLRYMLALVISIIPIAIGITVMVHNAIN